MLEAGATKCGSSSSAPIASFHVTKENEGKCMMLLYIFTHDDIGG